MSFKILFLFIEKIKKIDIAAPIIPKWEFSVNIKLVPLCDISTKNEHADDTLVELLVTNDFRLNKDKIVSRSIKIRTI